MGRIIKTRFYCKGTSSSAPRGSGFNNITWVENFIEGKWYDGEYQLWYDEAEESERNQKMFKINARWKRYNVVNEQGQKKDIHISYMNITFEMKLAEQRDNKINEILKK
jgi:hypothetical protein